jgi:ribosomal protein L7Ae-like RNA K-turn-binding protein
MEHKDLQECIRNLAMMDETDSVFISCYLNLERDSPGCRDFLKERELLLAKSVPDGLRKNFSKTVGKIHSFLGKKSFRGVKGVAIFSREGSEPFFIALEFRVPLPNQIVMDLTPHIYPLIELMDTYHRYVVVISTEESARILEVHTGSVTESLWMERPELRKRIGREWTKEHYRNHRKDRSSKFIKDKIRILEQVMSAGGHTHLILAGSPQRTSLLKKALPKRLADRLVDTVVIDGGAETDSVVEATLAAFIDQEQKESLAAVEMLQRQINTNGLAVAGSEACLEALKCGQADMLVLAKEFYEGELKEELVRLAVRHGIKIETVSGSHTLNQHGGVGCLLRYLLPEHYT